MSRRIHAGAILWALTALAGIGGCSQQKPAPPIQVLMIVGGKFHDYEKLPPELARRLTERGEMRFDIKTDPIVLEDAGLNKYDVVLFNTCVQNGVTPAARQALMDFIRSGKGLVAMHCSLYSYQDWPEWTEMIGGFAPGHDKFSTYSVTVLDPSDATMMSLGGGFSITDEPYIINKRDPRVRLLIRTTDVHKDNQGKLRDGPEPQVWRRPWGQGRVLSITFGHDDRAQSSEQFISLMHNGIRWAAGRLPETPHNALTRAERQEAYQLLFDGKGLDGWTGDTQHWSAENGELVGRSANLPHNMFLVHQSEYGDFLLKFSVKLANHNSGVQFRSQVFPESIVKGYQADIADRRYGNLYEEAGPRRVLADGWTGKGEKVARVDGWNDMTVQAQGPHIKITLNGITTVDYEEKDPKAQPASGVLALQLHAGPAMEVRFRDIRIKPLR